MNNPWIGLIMALIIGFLWIITGKWTGSGVLYLAVLVIMGALFPPLAIAIGMIAITMLVLTHPQIWQGTIPGTWQSVKGATTPQQGAQQ